MKIRDHHDLEVYQLAFECAMKIFKISKTFPKEEIYSLTDQIRRASRSVTSNIAEAFRKRRYSKALISKLNDAESEAAETQVWLDYSLKCNYLGDEIYQNLYQKYNFIIGKLVNMERFPEKWSV